LGKLTDPVCGHTWYVGSGLYTLQQVRAIFQLANKLAKHSTQGISGEGAWMGKMLGWFCGLVCGFCIRLEAAAFMIPIQAIVRLLAKPQDVQPVDTPMLNPDRPNHPVEYAQRAPAKEPKPTSIKE
jgi:hypothetical protein